MPRLAATLCTFAFTCATAYATPAPTCTITFDKEAPVAAHSIEIPGQHMALVAESIKWPDKAAGTRIEIDYSTPTTAGHYPITVYHRSLARIEQIDSPAASLQVPVIQTSRQQYLLPPNGESLNTIGPTGESVAFAQCRQTAN